MTLDAWGLAMAGLVAATLRAATPILLSAIGGLLSELGGCINVALEGMMLLAAFAAVAGAWWAGRSAPALAPWACAWIGCGAGVATAMLAAAILALFHLRLGADPVAAGIAINLLADGATVFLLQAAVGDKGSSASIATPALPVIHIPGLESMPVLDVMLNGEDGRGFGAIVWAAVAAALALAPLLGRTRAGTWLRAIGEHEAAAAAAGIPIATVRWRALLASGIFAGLAGSYLSLSYLTLFQAGMSAGRGFLALAAVFLGGRRPIGTIASALLFGGFSVAATRLGASGLSVHVAAMLPAVSTIAVIVLVGAMRRNRLPTPE